MSNATNMSPSGRSNPPIKNAERPGLSSYRQVYGILLSTYGKNWYVRLSFLLALASRLLKFVALPITASQLIASLANQNYGQAKTFIEALPYGFDSIVGERGVKLSGGQKQRIAIARAVLQNAPIVIAHRLSTIADLDRIMLLHQGKVLEDGTHNTLLKKKGVYAKLWNRQRLHPEDLETNDLNLQGL